MADSDEESLDPMNPESWHGTPGVCGSCIAWKPHDPKDGEEVASGECRLRPELGRVPATLKKCDLHKARGQYAYQPGREPAQKKRKRSSAPRVLRRGADGELVEGKKRAPAPAPAPMPRELEVGLVDSKRARVERSWPERNTSPPPKTIKLSEEGDESVPVIRTALIQMVRGELGRSTREIAGKFRGGTVGAALKEGKIINKISTEQLFAILDRLRSSIDALEDAILVHEETLGESETEAIVGSIRRVRGTFTTFNVIFSHKEDHFTSKG